MSDILSDDYVAAEEGKFFTSFLGATANTAVATITVALGQTSPSLVVFNGQPEGGKNLYMRYAKFSITTAQTGSTSMQHVGVLNSGSVHTTVGTAMSAPVNVNGDSGVGSLTKLYGGVNVMSTPAAAGRVVHTGEVDNSIPIVLDTWNLVYGEQGVADVKIGTMTAVKHITVPLPPVVVSPQQYYTLGFWAVATDATAATLRMNAGWIEQ